VISAWEGVHNIFYDEHIDCTTQTAKTAHGKNVLAWLEAGAGLDTYVLLQQNHGLSRNVTGTIVHSLHALVHGAHTPNCSKPID